MNKRKAEPWTEKTLRDRCTEVGECLIWDHGVNGMGYPQAHIDGKGGQMVRRWVFTRLMGNELKKGHVVSAKCEQILCCSQGCLVDRTYSVNLRKSYKDGKRCTVAEYTKRQQQRIDCGFAKLNLEKARQIRARKDESSAVLAAEFGITTNHVTSVWREQCWKEAAANSSVFAWRPHG